MEWFNRSGVGAISDLQDSTYLNTFDELEKWSNDFLLESPKFLSKDYIWPRDPLHTWSRIWEYPFIYSNIISVKNANKNDSTLKIVDVGSGVTFFPFALAASGMDVYCTDFDPIIERDMQLAIKTLNNHSGKISFKKTDGLTLPFEDNSIDIIYCISVLEHIPKFENTVKRMIADKHYVGPHSDRHLLYIPWENRDSLLITRKQFDEDLTANLEQLHKSAAPSRPWICLAGS